jgi:erythromycin esterase
MTRTTPLLITILVAISATIGCRHNAPPPVPPPPAALDDQAAAALRWVDAHAVNLETIDSAAPASGRRPFDTLIGNARIVGVSEMMEGAQEFAPLMQTLLRTLAVEHGVRALAIQAPMGEAFDIDRYVRGGPGDPRRLLPSLGAEHWETAGFLNLVEWMRSYNRGRPAAQQIGFYGFEVPSLTHAIKVVTSLSDSVAGAPLKAWLTRSYQCVADGASANWGREGYAADSTFWIACRGISAAVADSLTALRQRSAGTPGGADVAFAENMSRMVQHTVATGLRHLSRSEAVAEHVDWIANQVGAEAKLLVWGRDVEVGRLRLDSATVQMAVPLSEKYGDKYRALAFAVGDGAVRAVRLDARQGGGQGSPTGVTLARPLPGTYEDVLIRAGTAMFFVDMRALPSDSAGTWLAGPHRMRLVSGAYSALLPQRFETPVQFPKNFDGVVFIHTVTPATLMKR